MTSPLSSYYCKTPVSGSESPSYFKQLLRIKDARLKKLKQLYEEEVTDRSDLHQEFSELKKEVETLRRESREKTALIRQLNENLSLLEAQQQEENEDEKTKIQNSVERKFRSEFRTLEQRFDHVLKERNELGSWKEKNEAKLKTLSKDLHIRSIEVCELLDIKQALTETVEEQNHEINSLKSTCIELREMVTQLNPQKNVSFDESFQGHMPEVTDSMAVVVELQLQDKIGENEKLLEQLAGLKANLHEKDDAVTCLKEELNKLTQEMDRKSTEIQSLSATSIEFEKSLSDKIQELESAKKAMEDLVEDNSLVVASLRGEIASLQNNIQSLTFERDTLKNNVDEKTTELQVISSNYEEARSSNQALNQRLQTLESTLNEKLEALADCVGINQRLEEDLNNLRTSHSNLEESKGQVVLQLNGIIAELETDFNNLSKQYETLKHEFDSKCSEALSLSLSYEKEQDQNRILIEKLNQVESSLQEKSKELCCRKEFILALEDEMKNMRTAFSELEESKSQLGIQLNGTISQLQSNLSELTNLHDTLKCNFDEKCAEALTLSSNYENEQDKNQQLGDKLNEVISALDEKLEELAAANKLSVKLEDDLNSLQSSYLEVVESKNELMIQRNEDIEKLQNYTSELTAEIESLKNDIHDKNTELQVLRSSYAKECAVSQELNEKLCSLEMSLDMKFQELSDCKDVVQQLRIELLNSQTSFEELEGNSFLRVSGLEKEILKLEQNIDELTSQNLILNQDASEKSEELQHVKDTIMRLEENKNQLVSNLQENIISLQSNMSELAVQNNSLKNDINEKCNEVQELKETIVMQEENKNQEISQLQSKISELQNDISKLTAQNDSLNLDINEKSDKLKELNDLMLKSDENNNQVVSSLKDEVLKLESDINNLTAQNNSLEESVNGNVAELQSLSSRYENACSTNENLNQKLDTLECVLNEKLKKLADSEEVVKNMAAELENVQTVCTELEKSKEQVMIQLNGEIAKLQNDFDQLMLQNNALQHDVTEKSAELLAMRSSYENECEQNQLLNQKLKEVCCLSEDLSRKLETLESTLNEKLEKLGNSEKVVEKLEAELETLKMTYSELENSKEQITIKLNAEILKLQNDFDKMTQQNNTLQHAIAEKSVELLAMRSSYENECDQNQLLNQKFSEVELSLVQKLKELASIKEIASRLEDELTNLKVAYSELEKSKHEAKILLNEEITNLQNEIKKLTEQNSSLNHEIEENQAELLRVKSNHETERERNQLLNNKVVKLESSISEKLKELADGKEVSSRLEEELTNLKLAYSQLEESNHEAKILLNEEITNLQSEIKKLTEQNSSLNNEIEENQVELLTVKSNYETEQEQNQLLNNKVVELESSISEKLKELADGKEVSSRLEEELTNLKLIYSQLEENKSQTEMQLNKEITKLQSDFKNLTEQNSSLNHEIEDKEAELLMVKSNYENERDQNQHLNLKVIELESSINEKLKELTDSKEVSSGLKEELTNLKLIYSQLEENKTQTEMQLNEEITKLQNDFMNLREQNSSLNHEIEEKQAELLTMKSIYENELEVSSKLREELTDLKLASSHLKEIKNEDKIQFNEEVTKLRSDLNKLTEQNNNLQHEIEEKCAELITVTSSYENERDQNQQLNKQLIELEFSLGETFKELTSSKEISQKLEDRMNCLNSAHSDSEESNNQVLLRLNEKIAILQSDLNNSIEQNNTLKCNIEAKCAELLTMSLNQESERDKNQRLNEKLSELETSLGEKLKELNNSKETAQKLEGELKELKTKFMEFADNNNQVVTNMKGEFLQMETYTKELTKQNNDLRAEIDQKSAQLQNLSRSNEGEASENAKTLDEIKGLLEKNVEMKEENAELKEAYNKLLDDFERQRTEMTESNEVLSKQVEEYREASHKYESKWKERMKQVKEDYEGQLTKIKQYMTKHYHDKMDKQEKEAEEKLKMYTEKIAKDQDHIKELSSQIWNLSEKYLQAQQEIRNMTTNSRRATISQLDLAKSPDGQLLRSMSVDHLRGGWEKEREKLIVKNDNNDIVDEVTYTRRRKLVPSGIGKKLSLQSGKVFPSEEDEDGEMFDAACLADLKEGRVRLSPDRDMRRTSSRLSILRQRNSLCPPHLKSSYPAETQFIHPNQIKEDDIKVGLVGDNCSDTASIVSNPDRKKKDAGQTLYKKPGPPTPSKHGGRLSHGGGPLPKSPVENKENVNSRAKHPSTPSKIMGFFRSKMRRDERPPVAFQISPGLTPTPNRSTRRSGFFGKKSERV